MCRQAAIMSSSIPRRKEKPQRDSWGDSYHALPKTILGRGGKLVVFWGVTAPANCASLAGGKNGQRLTMT